MDQAAAEAAWKYHAAQERNKVPAAAPASRGAAPGSSGDIPRDAADQAEPAMSPPPCILLGVHAVWFSFGQSLVIPEAQGDQMGLLFL